jgi:hypothetical protein
MKEAVFLSTNRRFAIKYAMSHHEDGLYLYMCKLTKPVNLFNIMASHDLVRMREYLQSIESKDDIMSVYQRMLQKDAHVRRWDLMETEDMLKGYRELGFDGFTATERAYADDPGMPFCENIAVFDGNHVNILKQYTRDDLTETDYL